ncbi:MAG: radical SAM protein [Patescibacteria group bacterium]|nr:radical SAM protein [Patescibacteria group bacterium]
MTDRIDGLTILVGTAACNAHCRECAGRQHRPNAPTRDGELNEGRLREALAICFSRGCCSISLNGSGEPTLSPLSVMRTLTVIGEERPAGVTPYVGLYTNGLKISSDSGFCDEWLPQWFDLGLKGVHVSVFSEDEELNRRGLGVEVGPSFETVFERLIRHGLRVRVNVILKRGYTDTLGKFRALCERFFALGASNVFAWPVKDPSDDSVSELAPPAEEIERMRAFAEATSRPGRKIRLLVEACACGREPNRKLALFQDGTLSNAWCSRR